MLGAIAAIFLAVGIIILILVFSFPSRNAIPPPEITFKKSKVIWGLWNTGEDVLSRGLITNNIKKLLLMNPEGDGFHKNMELTSGDEYLSKKAILDLTKLAQKEGIQVKWYDNLQNITLTFFSPSECCENDATEVFPEKAWCIMRDLKPPIPAKYRPMYKYTNRKKGKREFAHKLSVFNNIWENHSSVPSIDGDGIYGEVAEK